ncbi:hypothetical protein N7532_000853 [Penicillium argentinense]|uniref:Major facilitator superfamily (MFS) profile domain-containing protein n=1 Tax=Penicillium argentinense TaxID=1131581 RepID=A0A9W9G653_9EURO|nr:uncharacterized protein N7532_000853 [Penicillium argentinense]KAJ5112808.1 hypothetical protein N7532_000853 [Penicillium argentinense]
MASDTQSGTKSPWAHVLEELGLATMWCSSRDVKFLCAQRFVRLFAYGGSTLVLASYLSAIGITDDRIGLFMTLTLIGDVVISFFLTLFADAMGRRAVLSLGSILMAGSGVVFALFGNYWILLAAAVFGVISPSGNEIGPFRAVEESTLAHLTPKEQLSDVFAWYSLVGTAGTALGQLVCGWTISSLQSLHGWAFIPSCRIIFFVYAGVGLLKLLLTLVLSREMEAVSEEEAHKRQQQQQQADETRPLLAESRSNEQPATPNSRKSLFASLDQDLWSLVIRLFILFGLDAFASGLASLSWMTYFFRRKFSLPEGELGTIFFVTSTIAAASMLVASSIAKRIGNVKPLARHSLPQLSPSDRRTAIMGAVNVVKTTTQSLGPLLTGILARNNLFGVSFIIAGCLKVIYDLGMLFSFGGKEAASRKLTTQENEEETR